MEEEIKKFRNSSMMYIGIPWERVSLFWKGAEGIKKECNSITGKYCYSVNFLISICRFESCSCHSIKILTLKIKNMKKIPMYIRIPIFIFILIYLLVSFIKGNINCISWSTDLRFIMILVWGIFSAFALVAYYDK